MILHGHTHRYRLETIDKCIVFNPGECAGLMKNKNQVGIINLETIETKIINFLEFFFHKKNTVNIINSDVKNSGLAILIKPLLSRIVDSKINMVNIGARLLTPGLENQIETIIDRERLKTIILRIFFAHKQRKQGTYNQRKK